MTKTFVKTYNIELLVSYERQTPISDDDLNLELLKATIEHWMADKIGSINMRGIEIYILASEDNDEETREE